MELRGKFVANDIEQEIRRYLDSIDLKSLIANETRGRGESICYIEGPPTMNGDPHAGHLRGRIIKDLWYRYNVLQKTSYSEPGGIHKVFLLNFKLRRS